MRDRMWLWSSLLAFVVSLVFATPSLLAGEPAEGDEAATPAATPAGAPAAKDDTGTAGEEDASATCLECHTDPDTTKTVDGKEVPLVVDAKAWKSSVHAGEGCVACHADFDPDDVPHAKVLKPLACTECHDDDAVAKQVHGGASPVEGLQRPTCTGCHSAHAVQPAATLKGDPDSCLSCHQKISKTAYRASAHGRGAGSPNAACVDCHGSHVILAAILPEAPTNPGRVSKKCGECHDGVQETFERGMHWRGYRKGVPDAPVCTTCHDPHGIEPMGERTAAAVTVADTKRCMDCHLESETAANGDSRPDAGFIRAYARSVHGRKGDDGRSAATCVDCHGAHDTGHQEDPQSPLGRTRTEQTCGRCHAEPLAEFQQSIHSTALAGGMEASATCTDCHGEHSILSAADPRSRANVAHVSEEACGSCHGSVRLAEKYGDNLGRLETYEDTYHGMAVVGGSVRAANCSSCHGYHLILPSSDPRSMIHPDHLVETCGKCHPTATERFTRIPVHSRYEEAEYPVAFTVKWIYIILILVVIGGMAAHNVLIWLFFVRRKWRHEKSAPGYQRWMKFEILQHVVLALTFTLLAVSGFALKFPDAFWVQPLKDIGFDEELRRWIHRVCAITMTVASLVQAGYFVFHRNGRRDIWALMPRVKDLVDFWQNMLYHLGRRATPPRFDRFDYTEKAEYLALIWGTAVMALTGLVLWIPEAFYEWAPAWLFDVAQIVHYYEAWLATLAILVWHFFFVFLHPREYPMSTVWLNGRMTEHEWRERHPLEYERETGRPAEETPGDAHDA